MWESELRTLLKTVSGMQHVDWYSNVQHAPFPRITISLINDTDTKTHDGENRLFQANVQIDVWAESYIDAVTKTKAIRNGIDYYTGQNSILGILVDQVRASAETTDTAKLIYRQIIEISLVYAP